MAKLLNDIAQELFACDRKTQLIYAFNGVGKTRLSREFKQLVAPPEGESTSAKILYYSAFTEDLFYWDNDLENDTDRKLIIHPNSFTDWLLRDEGMDKQILENFSAYTKSYLSPEFNKDFSEIRFFLTNNDGHQENIKISKSEESCFIWCIFYTMLQLVVDELDLKKSDRSTSKFNNIKYIFIDDPVTSLDENNLIELATDLAELIKKSPQQLKFIITTHNPLFYNVVCNSLNNAQKYNLVKFPDETYDLKKISLDSPFSYHLYLLHELKNLVNNNDEIKKHHFNFLRNILEKTSTFLGYTNWSDLLNLEGDVVDTSVLGNEKAAISRLINISSHSKFSSLETHFLKDEDKEILKNLTNQIIAKFHFKLPL